MISSLLTLFVVGIAGLLAVGVVLAIVGTVFGLAFGLAGFLLFKVVPVVIVGYLLMRFLAPKRKKISAADRKWLQS